MKKFEPKTSVNPVFWPHTQPVTKEQKVKRSPAKCAPISVIDDLVICNDPPPRSTRGPQKSKYEPIFSRLVPGAGVKCNTEMASRVATALRTWIKNRGLKDVGVSYISDYGDGQGRVWMIGKE